LVSRGLVTGKSIYKKWWQNWKLGVKPRALLLVWYIRNVHTKIWYFSTKEAPY